MNIKVSKRLTMSMLCSGERTKKKTFNNMKITKGTYLECCGVQCWLGKLPPHKLLANITLTTGNVESKFLVPHISRYTVLTVNDSCCQWATVSFIDKVRHFPYCIANLIVPWVRPYENTMYLLTV
ncbi:hypothetical protein DPMN_170315 [Dreissena polymorpha]|uniref:Uncharacterized protein n=1 Tax=Dreissena polymorpha TaxID=45954 RepID=A0A9D4IEG6_DREPO|nr:hypothetical protein DPMN_170315 [Dreissena polymorpha]